MLELCAAPSTKPQALLYCLFISVWCEVMLARRGGEDEKQAKVMSQDTEAKSFQFHSNFLCNGAELPCCGTDYKPAGYVKRKQDFFPEREPSCSSKWSWQHGSLLTLHTEPREVSVRGPGDRSKQSCLRPPRPGQQTRGSGARPELGEVQMWRHPSPGLPGLHNAPSGRSEADDLLAKQPRAGFVSNISTH